MKASRRVIDIDSRPHCGSALRFTLTACPAERNTLFVIDTDQILATANELATRVEKSRDRLVAVLTQYETAVTADDEIDRSVRTLQDLTREASLIDQIQKPLRVAAFLPVNQPLYSLVLFGILPCLMAGSAAARPPEITGNLVPEILQTISGGNICPNLSIAPCERQDFIMKYVRNSDVTIFTGTFQNASRVIRHMPSRSCFVFNGSGVNPIIVGPDADLSKAVPEIIRAVTYNSGQDCASPDCVMAHESIAEQLLSDLTLGMSRLNIGPNSDPDTQIGPIYRADSLMEYLAFSSKNRSRLVSGGIVDMRTSTVSPTVFSSTVDRNFNFPELYAPVANIGVYTTRDTLQDFFDSDTYRRRAMYATIYGSAPIKIPRTQVLTEKLVLDFENGNQAFGGAGDEASFYKLGPEKPRRGAVLISDVLARYSEWKCA